MRYPAADTAEKHDRIVREASKLFRARGFAGVTVAEVMKAAGLTHGAFYAHFPSKDALACAGLEAALDGMMASAASPQQNAADGQGAKAAFVARYLGEAHRDNHAEGCAMAALGAEAARDPALRRSFTRGLKKAVEQMAARFAWKRTPAPERQALALLSTLVGAVVLARAVEDDDLSALILDAALDRVAG